MRITLTAILILAAGSSGCAAKTTRFWNLTDNTITKFQLAPAGSDEFGPDQCKSDKDGAVDHDERLKIADLPSGAYDARFTDAKNRTCTVKNVDVKQGEVVSIEEKQLCDCKK